MAPAVRRFDGRQADLAAIHIAKKKLGWDEDMYRDILSTVCSGIRSSAELDFTGRKRWLAHLQACIVANGGPTAPHKGKAWSPSLRRIWAAWQQLADAGLVQDRNRAALNGWIRTYIKVDAIEFLNPQQIDQALAMLKSWLKQRAPEPR